MATSYNLIGEFAIVQGKTFEKLDFFFPGDVSLYVPKAQVRKRWHYKEVGKDPIIEFTFLPLLYNDETDKTLVRPRLTATQTAALPITVYQGEGNPEEATAYVWDLELTDEGTGRVVGLEWGWVQIKPEVTKL